MNERTVIRLPSGSAVVAKGQGCQALSPKIQRRYLIALTLVIFVAASLAAGRVYRAPFDDEISSTFNVIDTYHLHGLIRLAYEGTTADVYNAPLAQLIFASAMRIGLGLSGLRWVSLTFTAVALGTWSWIALDHLEKPVSNAIALIVALAMATTPLTIGLGDALRYYPLFAMLIAIAYFIYLKVPGYWYWSAIPLGIAADACPLAILPFAALLLHRYAIDREFNFREDLVYWLLSAVIALPGFLTFLLILRTPGYSMSDQIEPKLLVSIFRTFLGFFGGFTLGVSQSWLALMEMAASGYLATRAWRLAKSDTRLRRICLLIIVTAGLVAILPIFGLDIVRSFVFLAPMIMCVACIGLSESLESSPVLTGCALSAMLIVSLTVVGSGHLSRTPFKRNLAIPFYEVARFVRANGRRNAAVVTSDPVIAYLLRKTPRLCVATFVSQDWTRLPKCLTSRSEDSVIVITRQARGESNPKWRRVVSRLTSGKSIVAAAGFGVDEDARLKSWLTGVRLPRTLMMARIYR